MQMAKELFQVMSGMILMVMDIRMGNHILMELLSNYIIQVMFPSHDKAPLHCLHTVARPVSYYALFKGVAASKPTSWLSGQLHIISHLVVIWGP